MSDLVALMEMSDEERTPAQKQAILIHERLVYDKQMVEIGLANLCRDLKEMRDGKHYAELGFKEFGDYTEQVHGIGSRQAYKYIRIYKKLGVEVLNSGSKIGVTKLLAIASLDKEEQAELFAEHSPDELAAMSKEEVKRLTEKVRNLEEQLSFLKSEEQSNGVAEFSVEEIEADIRTELEEQFRTEYDDKFETYRQQAEKDAMCKVDEMTKKLKADIKSLKDSAKATADALEKANEERKTAEEKARKAEEIAAKSVEFEKKAKIAEKERAAMEKQIRLSTDSEFTRFKFLFEAWQNASGAMIEQLLKLSEDKQSKMKQAIKTVMEAMGV